MPLDSSWNTPVAVSRLEELIGRLVVIAQQTDIELRVKAAADQLYGIVDNRHFLSPRKSNFTRPIFSTYFMEYWVVIEPLFLPAVVTVTFSKTQPATPAFNLLSQTFLSAATPQPTFSISSTTTNAAIAFTIDGGVPDPNNIANNLDTSGTTPPTASAGGTYLMANGGNFYCAHAGGSFTLNAVAFVTSGSANFSSVAAIPAAYSFQLSPPTWAGPQPQAAYYAGAQSVSLSCASGSGGTASMTYSTTGASSDVSNVAYGVPITVAAGNAGSSRSETITAIAHQTDWQDSTALSDVFSVCGPGLWCDSGSNSKWDQATWQ